MADSLALFSPPVGAWFRETFAAPTPPQAQGWPAIARGEHALILSPTGSGKTLTAFLWSLDVLFRELRETPEPEKPTRDHPYRPGIRVVYVSPLKALNNDVERNLQVPLHGIRATARRLGDPLPPIRVAVRTGDTPASDRQRMLRQPPHVLITTPESLYLMLTADRARALFATTHTVIVDEIHTLVGSKRGAHLALSLERLTLLTERPIQRVGLSATVHPVENASRFLGGQDPRHDLAPRPVTVVDAAYRKPLDLEVITAVESFRDLPGDSVWTEIIPRVVDLIEQHRTTLVFCNSRRLAERTADRINERRLVGRLGGDRETRGHDGDTETRGRGDTGIRGHGDTESPSPRPPLSASPRRGTGVDMGIFASGVDASLLRAAGLEPIRAHHGSMSRGARLEMESALKSGAPPALVATSSLELGIDIGDIDLVVHLQSPKSVAAGLQRVGRSGHLVGQTSVGRVFTTHVEDVMEAAAVAHGMLHGAIESTHTPENPLDVLAQHVVAMAGSEEWDYDALYTVVRGAYPFRNLGPNSFRAVVEMLSGKYPERVSRQLQARLSWDRVNNRLIALPGSRGLAIQSGGTIPDRGAYTMVLPDRRTKVGELDEEFVFETRKGDTFLLGSQVWRAIDITEDRIVAEPAPGEVPRMPFWRGDYPWRPYDLGRRIGAFRRQVADALASATPAELDRLHALDEDALRALAAGNPPTPNEPPVIPRDPSSVPFASPSAPPVALNGPSVAAKDLHPLITHHSSLITLLAFLRRDCALDRNSILQVVDHVSGQLASVGAIASDRCVVVELFEDAIGDPRMVVHSPFGGRVNGPWAIVLAAAIRERLGVEAQINAGDDGILLRFANADVEPPADLVRQMTSQEARERILADLPSSAVFTAQFRMNAARALLLPRQRGGKRTPLWLSRLRAKDLLQAVLPFDDFPIVLETYRDCLRDVMDLDGLTDLLDRIQRGEIQVVVHEAELPSSLAHSLDQRFAMQYVYEYDQPRGERQIAQLSLNRALLAELLQDGRLADLLKPEAVAEVTARVARTGVEVHARSVEELAQVLYEQGDLSAADIADRSAGDAWPDWVRQLAGAERIVQLRLGDQDRWVHAEHLSDYQRLAEDPLPVLRRRLMHSGPTSVAQLAARYGLPEHAVRAELQSVRGDILAGVFVPGGEEEWIDRRNLEQMHRRTLTLLRREVQPVPIYTYAEFLKRWQHAQSPLPDCGDAETQGRGDTESPSPRPPFSASPRRGTGADVGSLALNRALQQLRGFPIPAVAWERDVLPLRVPGFDPAALAERCQSGELMWVAAPTRGYPGRDPRRARVAFFFRGEGGIFLDRQPADEIIAELGGHAGMLYDFLREEGAALLPDLAEGTGLTGADVQAALVELVLAGLVTNDTMAALHALLGYEPPSPAHRGLQSSLEAQLAERLDADRPRPMTRHRMLEARRRARIAVQQALRPPATGWIGRWSLVHRTALLGRPLPDDERALRQARQLVARWGVVTRAALERESATLRWDTVYPALVNLELRGELRRGYFVEGLPGVQFASPNAVEQLRAVNAERNAASHHSFSSGASRLSSDGSGAAPTVLCAADPAQLFGTEDFGGPLQFARVASTAVAAIHGEPIATMDDGGTSVDAVSDHPQLVLALPALAAWWKARIVGSVNVERWNGQPVVRSPGAPLLEAAGFVRDYATMVWSGTPSLGGSSGRGEKAI